MAEAVRTPPPEGFVPALVRGGFSTHNGPYYHRPDDGTGRAEQAFFAEDRHCNGYGIVHGGMLSAFLDGVMSQAAYRATQKNGVTIHLSIDYLHMARPGEWVTAEARVTRATRDIAFLEGRVSVGGVEILRATAVFKLMHKR